MVQFGGDTREEVGPGGAADARRAARRPSTTPDVAFLDDPASEDELWQVREAGLGATAHVPGQPRHLGGLGGLRRRTRTGSATTCATCSELYDEFGYSDDAGPACTATSARAACTPGSRSTCTRAEGVAHVPPVHGARRRPGRRATAARCPASTATASPAASCCRKMFGDELVARVRRAQGDLRPGRPDEPGQGRRTRPGSTSTCGSAATGRPPRRRTCSSATRTTAARSPRPPTAASASASAASTTTTAAR